METPRPTCVGARTSIEIEQTLERPLCPAAVLGQRLVELTRRRVASGGQRDPRIRLENCFFQRAAKLYRDLGRFRAKFVCDVQVRSSRTATGTGVAVY